ncbi:hypothetical protein MLD38_023456 [Melastoma candidum]|uniref:Uncharacterized protein n=1 Tax=Melastoma candidum TaxID=119954 RepID=A0ACB9NQV7_9MYRT|nr:hypothetical protein MLD38_023456 [Melastoma candidum]
MKRQPTIFKGASEKGSVTEGGCLQTKLTIQQLLHEKSQELDKTSLECLSLQERSMASAKELAALKLVADLDLEEGEILKLSCLGNESNSRDTI